MGAHRLDRTGWRRASLAALPLLAVACSVACSGGGAADPTAAPPTTPATSAPAGRQEVGRVDASVEFMPEGVRLTGKPPQCVLYEVADGKRGTRYRVDVVLSFEGKPVFLGPSGTKVFYRVKVEAGGQAFDGYAGFAKPRAVEGLWVVDADPLTSYGTVPLQPENNPGIQEVPSGLSACAVSVRRPDQEASYVPGTRMVLQGDEPVIQDVDGNTHPLDES